MSTFDHHQTPSTLTSFQTQSINYPSIFSDTRIFLQDAVPFHPRSRRRCFCRSPRGTPGWSLLIRLSPLLRDRRPEPRHPRLPDPYVTQLFFRLLGQTLTSLIAPTTPTGINNFIDICAAEGQQAKCCLLPILEQALICTDVQPQAATSAASTA